MPAKPYDLPPDFADTEAAHEAPPHSVDAEKARDPASDVVRRSNRLTSGNASFILLKAANPLLQYLIFTKGWGHSVYAVLGLSAATPHIGMLSPKQKLLVGAALLGAARQIFWSLYINESPLSPIDAAHIAVYDLVADSTNTLLSLASSAWSLGPYQWFGSAAVLVGSAIETISELQRKWFKAKIQNNGRVNDGGLWRWCRHPNYAGFLVWRTGYAAMTENMWAFWNPGLHLCQFAVSAIPVLERFQQLKYTDDWARYTRATPYKLIPYVW
ncbi:hypothetical protein HDU88_007606 [Geranomyces variabilis]|nr:hypothetical protein HDU88_007606 [Geranomyces variabilis]